MPGNLTFTGSTATGSRLPRTGGLLDGKAPATGPLSYLDAASISDWAAGPVSGVTGAKVFYGSDGFFRPADNVTLQEMIVALWRIAQPHVETAAAAA